MKAMILVTRADSAQLEVFSLLLESSAPRRWLSSTVNRLQISGGRAVLQLDLGRPGPPSLLFSSR